MRLPFIVRVREIIAGTIKGVNIWLNFRLARAMLMSMTRRTLPFVLMLLIAIAPLLAQEELTPPAPGAARSPDAAQQEIPRQTLEQMYQRELGEDHDPKRAAGLYDAHLLIEKFFSAPTAAERQTVVKEIEAVGADPHYVGRIARIRMHWPELETGVYYVNERVGPHAVMYFLGVPKGYVRTRPWPLVIKLPGPHPFVTQPPPGADQVVELYKTWITEELEVHPDAVVLMPLLDLDELWGPSYKGMNSVMQPMHHVAGRMNIDPSRVYLLGHGMSGHATWNLALHYPTYFAAIAPMAGGASFPWQRVRLPNLRNVFCVVWHDADDQLIKVESSRGLVRALQNLKFVDVDYEETKDLGHAPSEEIAERLYQKMRSRKRRLYPPEIVQASNRPDALFNRNDWVQVYQQITPGKENKSFLRHGTGWINALTNSYAVSAALTGPNRIEARTQNLASMRIYVNDQMINFAQPVTVIVNGKGFFEGLVKPNIEEMLNDQLFLGRGWRYYTGIIDVDLMAAAAKRATIPTAEPGKGRIIVGPQ
jgi:pimeloyl-ACP methyl ester carboxylesterase